MTTTQLLTVKDVARLLQLSPRTVYRLIEEGDLEAVRVGPKTWRIHPDELAKFGFGSDAEATPEAG